MIGQKNYSIEELKRECHSKIRILEELIEAAKAKALGSKAREEYAGLIAVVLRVLTCKTSGTEGLLNQSQFSKQMIFPLYNPIGACNLLRDFTLLNELYKDKHAILQVRDDLKNDEVVYYTYLTFDSWLLESVIDFKDEDFPPLSRYEIIRLIADKRGAHFQPEIDGRLYKITHEPILPVIFEGKNISENLFTESVIGIADELVFSFRHMVQNDLQVVRNEDFVYIQEYENKPKKVYKYGVNHFSYGIGGIPGNFR